MDEIPEDIREKAKVVCMDVYGGFSPPEHVETIAYALLAERQSATAAERERCVEEIERIKKSVIGVYGKRSRFDQYDMDRRFRDACTICKEAITGEDATAWKPVENAAAIRGGSHAE